MNKLIETFKMIEEKKYCIGREGAGYCSTCGCMDAYNELNLIENIEQELISIDINKLLNSKIDLNATYKIRGAYSYMIIFLFNRFDFDKERVLTHWLDTLEDEQIKFFDMVLFYVIRRMKNCKIREKWINKCIILAEKTSNISLKESLFYTEHIDDGCMFKIDKVT